MQLITLEKSQTTKLFWLTVGLLMVVAVVTADQSDPGVTAAAVLLALVAMWPFYLWLLGSSHGLPIWPVFSLVTGVTYALPMIQKADSLSDYSAPEIIMGSITTIGFILLGTMIWLSMTSRQSKAPRTVLMIEQSQSVRYLLLFIGLGLLFGINQFTGWVRFPGNSMQVVRGITGSLSTMGLFVLAYYHGRGLLTKRDLVLFGAGAVATMLMNMTSLMLAQAVVPAAMVIFGYMLGSNQLPWRVLLVAFVAMGLLHPGKYEMRKIYWTGEGEARPLTLLTLPAFYWDWFSYGFQEVGSVAGIVSGSKEEDSASSIFERSGNLHMLLLVQKKTPDEVPYFNGATYSPIPRLLIPRFIDDQKGISHAGNVMLTVNYGLQTLEQTASTSIGWGLLPEAYANFGYLGIAGLAGVLALFYGWITNLTVGVPMTSLRFVLGLLIMAAATRADTMGVFVTTQFQGVIGVSLAAVVLMKRRPNPFAAEGGGEGIRHTGSGIRHEATRKRQTAYGMRQEDGMPAPGVLTGLIEGEQPEAGDAGGAVFQKDGVSVGENGIRHEAGGAWQTANGRLHETEGMRHAANGGGEQVSADAPLQGVTPAGQMTGDGGTVRTMPVRTPQRIARWMPRRVRQQVAAEQRAAQADGIRHEANGGEQEAAEAHTADGKRHTDSVRPRQVAVPYRNYRRYRSG